EVGERRRALAEQLETTLARVGAQSAEVEQRVHAYLTAVEKHEQLRDLQGQLGRTDHELEQAQQPMREQRRLAQDHERAVRRLRHAYSVAGIEEEDLDQAAEAFERLVGESEHRRRQEQEARATLEAVRRARAEADERRRSLSEQLETTLDRVGVQPAELEQRVHAYLTAVERQEQLRDQQGR